MVNAAVQVAALAYQAVAGEQQRKAGQRGRRDAQQAARLSEDAALSEQRRAEEAENAARQKSPDLNVLLGDERKRKPGPGSIDVDKLLLGRPKLLGI